MPHSDSSGLPNIGDILAPLLARVPREQQALFIAIAERMAAERYRGWAADAANAPWRSELLACAMREESIAARIEALYPDPAALLGAIHAAHPNLAEINRDLFAGRPREAQLTIQARGERLGAATWRAFAEQQPSARAVFLACADLEEASAAVLEKILAA